MPTVPILRTGSSVQAAAPSARITARATPDTFGASIGEGISNLGGAGQQIARQEWQRINEAMVLEADTIDAREDLEARRQLEQAKGKAAGDIFGALEQARAKRQEEIERGDLKNPVQQEAFRRRAAARLMDFKTWGSGHVAREAEAYDAQVIEANIATGMERIKSSRNDWTTAAKELDGVLTTYDSYAERRGVPPEMRNQRRAEITSAGIRSVIDGQVNDKNDLAASRAFQQFGGRMLEKDRQEVAKLLEIGSRDGTAQRMVDQWMRDGMDLTALQTKLADTPELQQDTKLRDEVQSRAIQAINLRETAAKATQHDAYAKAYQIIQDPTKSYSDIPADLKRTLEARPDLDLHLRQLATQEVRATQTDRATYYGLQTEAATNPQAFAKRDLMQFATSLSDTDFKEMVKLQTQAKEGKGDKLDWLNTREDLVNQALAGVGIDPRPYRTEKDKVVANPPAVAFRAAVEKQSAALAAAAGRTTPSRDDVQKAIDAEMLKKVRLNRWGRDPERIAATLNTDERGQAYVPLDQIPGGQAEAIRALINRAGGDPTDDEKVQRLMAARLLEDRAMFDQILQER